jgi:hypothetical protein
VIAAAAASGFHQNLRIFRAAERNLLVPVTGAACAALASMSAAAAARMSFVFMGEPFVCFEGVRPPRRAGARGPIWTRTISRRPERSSDAGHVTAVIRGKADPWPPSPSLRLAEAHNLGGRAGEAAQADLRARRWRR